MGQSCLIMMALYNGERFLAEQIESIIHQTHTNWKLIIQDDGSTDCSCAIVEQYMRIDDRIMLWRNEGPHGAYPNFHALINKCKGMTYDFYMFCDHDDVWHPNKIESFISYYEQNCSNTEPTMIYADLRIIDAKGQVLSESINNTYGMQFNLPASAFFFHNVFGCNSFFNKALFSLVPCVDPGEEICQILSHDGYYAKFAVCYGCLLFYDMVLMDYRRYGGNVTASQVYTYKFKRIIKRMTNLDALSKDHALAYSQSIYTIDKILQLGGAKLSDSLLLEIKASLQNGGVKGAVVFIKQRINCGKLIKTISRFCVLLLGKYRKYL